MNKINKTRARLIGKAQLLLESLFRDNVFIYLFARYNQQIFDSMLDLNIQSMSAVGTTYRLKSCL